VGAFEIDYKWHWQKPYKMNGFVWTHCDKTLGWKVRCHTCIQHGHRWCWHCLQKVETKSTQVGQTKRKVTIVDVGEISLWLVVVFNWRRWLWLSKD
jgi:hypothetical protein